MNRNRTGVSAALMPVLAMATQPISGFCRQIAKGMSGLASTTATWARHDARRQSAQAEALERVRLLLVRREILERDRLDLIEEISRLKRGYRHRLVSDFDARLKQINAELLSIG